MAEGMTTEIALEAARYINAGEQPEVPAGTVKRAAVQLAGEVIATREAITDAVSMWQQYRENPHIPDELRRALDALAARRSSL